MGYRIYIPVAEDSSELSPEGLKQFQERIFRRMAEENAIRLPIGEDRAKLTPLEKEQFRQEVLRLLAEKHKRGELEEINHAFPLEDAVSYLLANYRPWGYRKLSDYLQSL